MPNTFFGLLEIGLIPMSTSSRRASRAPGSLFAQPSFDGRLAPPPADTIVGRLSGLNQMRWRPATAFLDRKVRRLRARSPPAILLMTHSPESSIVQPNESPRPPMQPIYSTTLPNQSAPLRARAILAAFLFLSALLSTVAHAAPTADEAEVVKANNAFAVELYGQLRSQPGNLFFSPESISTALAMTYAGARGDTAKEMATVLHFSLPPDELHSAMAVLLKDRNAAHAGYELKEADALWGQQGYTLLQHFLNLMEDDYSTGFNSVNFEGDTEKARKAINKWIEQQTANKITTLIAPGVLDHRTRLVLTSAIYFKGTWQTQFDPKLTEQENFHVSPTETTTTPLMHRTAGFKYFDGHTFQALEIPYKDDELSMIVFLPNNVGGLPDFEQSLTPNTMHQWLTQLRPHPVVIVTMPKFKFEAQFALKETLQPMGLKQAFDRVHADFTGITSREQMQRDGILYINLVIHKACVAISEEGTEAAAAMATVMETRRNVSPSALPRIFRADHPFLFLIRDNPSGSILFMGRFSTPSQ